MRARRILTVASLLTLAGLITVAVPVHRESMRVSAVKRDVPSVASAEEWQQLIRLTIAPNERATPYIVQQESVVFCPLSHDAESPPRCESADPRVESRATLSEALAPVPLRRALLQLSLEQTTLTKPTPDAIMISAASLKAMAESGDFWAAFHAEYPRTGYFSYSPAVISHDRRQALLYESHHCGWHCGGGTLYVFAHDGSRWWLVAEERLWVS